MSAALSPICVEQLLRRGADANAPDAIARSPLARACQSPNAVSVQTLLDFGADPEGAAGSSTPLCLAAAADSPELCKMLLDAGAGLDRVSEAGFTAFGSAAGSGGVHALRFLAGRGADLDLVKAGSPPPLILSLMGGKTEAAIFILESGADPRRKADGVSALFWSDLLGNLVFSKKAKAIALALDERDDISGVAKLGVKASKRMPL